MKQEFDYFEDYEKPLLKNYITHISIISSIKLGIFDLLENQFISVDEIIKQLKLNCRKRCLIDILDKLYAVGLIDRKGIMKSARYKSRSKDFLKSNPNNKIELTIVYDKHMNKYNQYISKLLRNKLNPKPVEDDVNDYLKAMNQYSLTKFQDLTEDFDFSKVKSVLDVGGGIGSFSVELKKKFPFINCWSFDLPECEKHIKCYLKSIGMENQITIISGDMFKHEFIKSDVIFMGNVLHEYSKKERIFLLKKVYDYLHSSGTFITIEDYIENSRNEDNYPQNISCLMNLTCDKGYNMTKGEFEEMTKEIGFRKVNFMKHGVICYKDNGIM
jgi:hypothetical protein